MSAQYIFTTYKLSRRYPPDREVLTDISLSFLPGAKIGVLGYNGAGKSTLLRIMAGIDTEFDGHAQLAPNATVGLLEQEPAARPSQGRHAATSRRASPRSGAARPLQRAVDELLRRDRRRVRAACRSRSTRSTAGTSTRRSRSRWTRCAARRPTPTSPRSPAASAAGSRSAGCCCASPTCCCSTSRPTTSTPSRSRGSSSTCSDYHGHGRRDHPRPLLPRQRRRLDPRARPRPRDPLPGQLLGLARAEARAARAARPGRRPRASGRSTRSSSGCGSTPARAATSPRRA